MKKQAENQNPPEENPYGLIGKMYEGAKKDNQSKILSFYIGGALIIAFLFLASLAPQVGEKLGTLSVKKQLQESQAAYNPANKKIPQPSPSFSPSPKKNQLYPAGSPYR